MLRVHCSFTCFTLFYFFLKWGFVPEISRFSFLINLKFELIFKKIGQLIVATEFRKIVFIIFIMLRQHTYAAFEGTNKHSHIKFVRREIVIKKGQELVSKPIYYLKWCLKTFAKFFYKTIFRSSCPMVLWKKMFLKISQNSKVLKVH